MSNNERLPQLIEAVRMRFSLLGISEELLTDATEPRLMWLITIEKGNLLEWASRETDNG
jgi:hypothetical protein